MEAKDAIRQTMDFCRQVLLQYIGDLADADLLVRPVPGANHIAWQLGHLIVSEHQIMTALGCLMPALPAGFAERYTSQTARSDNPGDFVGKAECLRLMRELREATLAALAAMPPERLDQPAPESMRSYAPTVAAALLLVGTHELMHAGQFVPIRRKLGKPPLF